jgi:hypothetical protein
MSSTSDPTAGVFVYTMTYGTAVITEPHKKAKKLKAKRPLPLKQKPNSTAEMPQNPL